MKFLFSVLLTTVTLSAQQVAPAPTPNAAPNAAPAASCPIRADEAYLTSEGGAMPAEGATSRRTLHVTIVDVSTKPISSYVVRARIAVRPGGTLTDQPQTAMVTRKWQGTLQPDTATQQQWTFPADRFTMGLQRVWFDKVVFADGTTWTKTRNDGCTYAATGHIVQTHGTAKPTAGIKAH